MHARHWALFALILLSPYYLFGQQEKLAANFAQVDSLALTIKYENDVTRLAMQLTNSFQNPVLKTRAIFKWITANIAYDYKYYNKYGYQGREPKAYKCDNDGIECDIRRQVWENEYINRVLNKRAAVCQGYAMLFKKMCNIVGIECSIVPGYVRTEYYQVGTPGTLDHAWNAVRLNGSYYLVDVTWASGGCSKANDGKLLSFEKQFNNYYWLTPPADFVRNHFPQDPQWALIKNYTKNDFSLNPYYDAGSINHIKLIEPSSGIIHIKKGDTLRFKIANTEQLKYLQINTNNFRNPDIWTEKYINKHKTIKMLDTFAIKKQQYMPYKQSGDIYEFAYIVKDNSLDYLDILFDWQRTIRFKLTYR